MKRILVPTDFSDTALKALIYAAELATKSGGTVTLLHVITPDENRVWRPHALDDDYEGMYIKKQQSKLDAIWNNMLHLYPDLTLLTELGKGLLPESIIDFSKSTNADLIIMGTTGASGFRQLFMGSVTASMIGKTNIPVLAVPASYEMKEPQTILFATNHFEKEVQLIEPVINLARYFAASIHLLVFVDTDDANPEDYIRQGRKLESYVGSFREEYPEIQFNSLLLDGSSFENRVEECIQELGADLFVMISYQKNFFERITGKSMTKKMAYHSTIPLLSLSARR